MDKELSAEQIQSFLQGISVPPQPQIMVDLQFEQLMPSPDLSAIARLISQDPGLSGTLLKIVNSHYFERPQRLASIQAAVNLLGSNSVINMVNGLSIRGEMSDETILTLNRFWDSAQDVAMTSLRLAKRFGYEHPDEAYALGLFHDCGIVLMLKRFDGYMALLEDCYANASSTQRIIDGENRLLKTNHAVVGYYTAKSWNLPLHLCDAIANHHNALAIFTDNGNSDPRLKNLLAILKMAEHICCSYQILGRQTQDHEWQSIEALILDYLDLSEYDFDSLRASLRDLGHAY